MTPPPRKNPGPFSPPFGRTGLIVAAVVSGVLTAAMGLFAGLLGLLLLPPVTFGFIVGPPFSDWGKDPEPVTAGNNPSSTPSAPASTLQPLPPPLPPRYAEGDLKARIDREYGTFAPVRRSGSGDESIQLPAHIRRGVVWVGADMSSPFHATLGRADGLAQEVIMPSEGPLRGSVPFGLTEPEPHTMTLEIRADGPWVIEISPISSIPLLTDSTSDAGCGLLLRDGPATTYTVGSRYTDVTFTQFATGGKPTQQRLTSESEQALSLGEGLSVIMVETADYGTWGIRTK